MQRYPILEINLTGITSNARHLVKLASDVGIRIAGVVKGADSMPEVAESLLAGGIDQIADSRIEKLVQFKKSHPDVSTMLLRIPAKSEIEDVVRYADYSLNSEIQTLRWLNEAAGKANVRHRVVLMQDLGDLREGFWGRDQTVEAALLVEREFKNLELAGVGVNLGCYGSIRPTVTNLSELVDTAKAIEAGIGRTLEIVSGGSTTTLPLLFDHQVPSGINHLRIGEGIILARDMKLHRGYPTPELTAENFVLLAEIIEIKTKPSYPIGEIFMDSFGKSPTYEDHGDRKRALLAVGRKDYGDFLPNLLPTIDGLEVVGGSSDHLIVDITDVTEELAVGDVLRFNMQYGSMMFLSSSTSVTKKFKRE